MTPSKYDLSKSNCCDRCGLACEWSHVRPVPILFRIAAFPMIFVMVLHNLALLTKPELTHRYCVGCYRRQVLCHMVVAVWSFILIAGFALGW